MSGKLEEIQQRLKYRFRDPSLLQTALTHASASAERLTSNERLEFLGDAVVGLLVSAHLFRSSSLLSEGDMSAMKSAVVSRRTMDRAGRALGLPEFLRVDEGLKQRKKYPVSMVAGAYEAVVGAIFVDSGIKAAGKFVRRTLGPELKLAQANQHTPSYKSILQHRAQADGKGAPRYSVLKTEGPDHKRRFQVAVRIAGEDCGVGWGATKRDAEQNAARKALDKVYPGWAGGRGKGKAKAKAKAKD